MAVPVPGHSLPVLPLLHTHPQVLLQVLYRLTLLKIIETLAKHSVQCICIVVIRVDTLLICQSAVPQ